jgi:hypothetical protein
VDRPLPAWPPVGSARASWHCRVLDHTSSSCRRLLPWNAGFIIGLVLQTIGVSLTRGHGFAQAIEPGGPRPHTWACLRIRPDLPGRWELAYL